MKFDVNLVPFDATHLNIALPEDASVCASKSKSPSIYWSKKKNF
jgi:hypothetical protein